MKKLVWFLLFVAVSTTVASSEAGPRISTDWPQWRGLHRDGISPETGLQESWPESGPPIVWSSSAGIGYSGVAVAGGRLYTLGDNKEGQYLMAFDAGTGELTWRQHLGATFSSSYGDGPRSTPLVGGDLVYAVGTDGLLVAADRSTGRVAWQHDLVKAFAAELPAYGISSSPLMVGDRLILEVGGAGATFVAFDRLDGKVLWRSQSDRAAYSSPIEAEIDGTHQVVFWSGSGLHAVSPADGKLLWKFDAETLCPATGIPLNTGTPIFLAPNRLYIASGSGAKMLRIAQAGGKWRPELLWETEKMRSDVNSAVAVGGVIYGFNRGILQAVDGATGEIRWQARGFSRGSLIAAGDKLIVLGENGNLALAEADPSAFRQLATTQALDGRSWTAPSLANGHLYLRNHEQLVALKLR